MITNVRSANGRKVESSFAFESVWILFYENKLRLRNNLPVMSWKRILPALVSRTSLKVLLGFLVCFFRFSSTQFRDQRGRKAALMTLLPPVATIPKFNSRVVPVNKNRSWFDLGRKTQRFIQTR